MTMVRWRFQRSTSTPATGAMKKEGNCWLKTVTASQTALFVSVSWSPSHDIARAGTRMASDNLDGVMRNLRVMVAAQGTRDVPDDELLGRYLRDGDETAFAALVQRHGGMVLGVCRNRLRRLQDAEDACQAVFLIL